MAAPKSRSSSAGKRPSSAKKSTSRVSSAKPAPIIIESTLPPEIKQSTRLVVSKIIDKLHDPYISFRVQQVDWDYSEIEITVPKQMKIYHLQNEIAKIIHLDSVLASDILVFKNIDKKDLCLDPFSTSIEEFFQLEIQGYEIDETKQIVPMNVWQNKPSIVVPRIVDPRMSFVYTKNGLDKGIGIKLFYDVKSYTDTKRRVIKSRHEFDRDCSLLNFQTSMLGLIPPTLNTLKWHRPLVVERE